MFALEIVSVNSMEEVLKTQSLKTLLQPTNLINIVKVIFTINVQIWILNILLFQIQVEIIASKTNMLLIIKLLMELLKNMLNNVHKIIILMIINHINV